MEEGEKEGNRLSENDNHGAVGGIRGQIMLGDGNWFIRFYGDIGAGNSDLTWPVFSGIGYSFKNWLDAMIGYRHMEWDDDGLIQDMRLSGPVIGARFNF